MYYLYVDKHDKIALLTHSNTMTVSYINKRLTLSDEKCVVAVYLQRQIAVHTERFNYCFSRSASSRALLIVTK
jgi:hypothetical protein